MSLPSPELLKLLVSGERVISKPSDKEEITLRAESEVIIADEVKKEGGINVGCRMMWTKFAWRYEYVVEVYRWRWDH